MYALGVFFPHNFREYVYTLVLIIYSHIGKVV